MHISYGQLKALQNAKQVSKYQIKGEEMPNRYATLVTIQSIHDEDCNRLTGLVITNNYE